MIFVKWESGVVYKLMYFDLHCAKVKFESNCRMEVREREREREERFTWVEGEDEQGIFLAKPCGMIGS